MTYDTTLPYRCECGLVGERCPDPKFTATDDEWRAFYAAHPFRALTGQSPRSRADDVRADRLRRAVGR